MNELSHYGILGMKWGVRRTPEQLGYTKITGKKKRLVKKLKSNKLKTDNESEDFDKEIDDFVNMLIKELDLENPNQIKRKNKSIKKGKKYTTKKFIEPRIKIKILN